MRLLVLGGTRFVGRAVVEHAVNSGHDVTLFNRGKTAPGLYPELETVIGDRTEDLSALSGREFDAVADCAGYDPATVRLSADFLHGNVGRYLFVSTCSVYATQAIPAHENTARLSDDSYGGRKAACEDIVRETYGENALFVRPGLITGPHDQTERFSYWPRRIARGGDVLAPGAPDDPMQYIDVRDLARFLLDSGASGAYNVLAPSFPFGELLTVCGEVVGVHANLVWKSTAALLAAGVDPWMGVPLWIAEPEWAAANLVDVSKARDAGLITRPLAETVADVHAWDIARGGPAEEPFSADRERFLLDL